MPAAPSLLIVPYRSKTGRLYSQIPVPVAPATTGAGDFTVTRNTEARRFNSAGLIASVASGIPRLDYYTSGGTAGCPALLVEPAATNLCRYSDQFDTVTSGWSPTALQTITGNTNATLDPAGGNTADLIVATTGNTQHYLQASTNNLPAFVSGTTYTYSVFAKATSAASGFVQIHFGAINFSPALPFANFQLSENGAITTGTYSSASIQPFGNGWYRCSMTTTAAASGNAAAVFMPILASGTARGATFAGNGVDGVYLWGAQLETGSVATSYIPTTAGTGSRSADVISVSGAVSGSIGQTEGTIYAEVDLKVFPVAGSPIIGIISLNVGAANLQNCILLGVERDSAGTNRFYSLVQRANATQAGIFGPSISAGVFKVAFAYKENDFTMYVNGVETGTPDTSGLLPIGSLSEVLIGTRFTGDTQFLNDRIRAAAFYTTRLTDAELATLTTP